jgi:hypothetical protein
MERPRRPPRREKKPLAQLHGAAPLEQAEDPREQVAMRHDHRLEVEQQGGAIGRRASVCANMDSSVHWSWADTATACGRTPEIRVKIERNLAEIAVAEWSDSCLDGDFGQPAMSGEHDGRNSRWHSGHSASCGYLPL